MKKRNTRRSNKSMQHLRAILGDGQRPMSQREFAALTGVSIQLIKAVEGGWAPLTEKLNTRIKIATGASLGGKPMVFDAPEAERVFKPFGDGLVTPCRWGSGHPAEYTKAAFEDHLRTTEAEAGGAELALGEAIPAISAVLKAAGRSRRAGLKPRLAAVRASLWDWIEETNATFQLGLKYEQLYGSGAE